MKSQGLFGACPSVLVRDWLACCFGPVVRQHTTVGAPSHHELLGVERHPRFRGKQGRRAAERKCLHLAMLSCKRLSAPVTSPSIFLESLKLGCLGSCLFMLQFSNLPLPSPTHGSPPCCCSSSLYHFQHRWGALKLAFTH